MEAGVPSDKQQSARSKLEEWCNQFQAKFEVPEMRPAELKAIQDAGGEVVVVDVRNHDEQQVSMIPGAITREEFQSQAGTAKDSRVVCYCTVGYRSSQFASSLRAEGIDSYNLRGSIMGWTQEGFPLVAGHDRKTPTTTVHSYAPTWAVQGPDYQAVSYRTPFFRLAWDFLRAPFQRKRA